MQGFFAVVVVGTHGEHMLHPRRQRNPASPGSGKMPSAAQAAPPPLAAASPWASRQGRGSELLWMFITLWKDLLRLASERITAMERRRRRRNKAKRLML